MKTPRAFMAHARHAARVWGDFRSVPFLRALQCLGWLDSDCSFKIFYCFLERAGEGERNVNGFGCTPERVSTPFDYIFISVCFTKPQFPPLLPFFLHHLSPEPLPCCSFPFRNTPFQTACSSPTAPLSACPLQPELPSTRILSQCLTCPVHFLFLRVMRFGPFVLPCAAVSGALPVLPV